MEYLLCALVGYGLGCISPSWMISQIKHTDIQKSGTGNLGTTNAFIHFGKGWGSLVLNCDMAKAFLAVKLCVWLFPGRKRDCELWRFYSCYRYLVFPVSVGRGLYLKSDFYFWPPAVW